MNQTGRILLIVCLLTFGIVSEDEVSADEVSADEVSADELFNRTGSLTGSTGDILPVDEAFRFSRVDEGTQTRLFWQVAPGYFLYRDKFSFQNGGEKLSIELDEGKWWDDETFGRVQVLEGLVEVQIPSFSGIVSVHYQGCAARGFCYPPQKKLLISSK